MWHNVLVLKTSSSKHASFLTRVDTLASAAIRIFSRFAWILLPLILVCETVLLLRQARAKIFWYDELITFHVASLPSFSLVWHALKAGTDGMPPGYYLMARAGLMLPGSPLISLRLPSLAGYLLTLAGVYWFARKRLPAIAGVAAVLLVVLSPFRPYAVEARPYALLVGFLALAAVCWQRIGEKRFMLPLFFLFLSLGVCCHYLALMVIGLFGVAELSWSLVWRRLRVGVWASCVLAVIPILIGLPIVLAYRHSFGKSFWAQPSWANAVTTYGDYLWLDFRLAFALVLFLGLVIARALWRGAQRLPDAGGDLPARVPELVLIGGFLFYPAVLGVLTKLASSGYTSRYSWPVILGLALAPVCLAGEGWIRRYGSLALLGLLAGFVIQSGYEVLQKPGDPKAVERWARLATLSRQTPGLPIVIGSPILYLQALEYGAPDIRGRLVEVLDEPAAIRLVGSDTVDRTNRLLSNVYPLRSASLADFESGYRRFLLHSGGYLDWFTAYALQNGYRLTLLGNYTDHSLYLVER